ncbi:MAG: family 16 glycosylhydrolase [Fimbriimonas sp.]|nr:family 16 glycosylhydrolase [Fimbriimonas sp.]
MNLIFTILYSVSIASGQGPLTDAQKAKWVDYHPNMPAEAVKRTSERYPLSDQADVGGWVRYESMTDEFREGGLDLRKWKYTNPDWQGRQPGWFDPANSVVHNGFLELYARKAEPAGMPKGQGYHTFTTAAIKSTATTCYGYFEMRAKVMNSAASSSFWFTGGDGEHANEIDIFEIGGNAPGFERKMHITVHSWRTPEYKDHWGFGSAFVAPARLTDDFHVYGFEWDPQELKFYYDGVLVRKGPNTHWHQALGLNIDSETMPEWFGLPNEADLPSVYRIAYLRAWKKRT